MSVPAAPKKCYTQLRDNRNGAKNNNESLLSLGDTNANEILLEVTSSRDEPETGNLTGNANSAEPETSVLFNKEFHHLQGFRGGPLAGPTVLKDSKLTPPGEKHMMERGTDILQTPQGQGPSQGLGQGLSPSGRRNLMAEATPEGSTKREANIPWHGPKDKLAKTLDNEELRRHSLERVGGPAVAGNLSHQRPPPAHLASTQAPQPVPSGGEGPPKTWPVRSLGAALPVTDSSSEGKSPCPPKSPTSEAKETGPSEVQREGVCIPRAGDETTAGSAHPEPAPNSPWASKASQPEAQTGLGKAEPTLDRKWGPSRPVQVLQPAQAERLECPEEGVLPLKRLAPSGTAQQETTAGGLLGALPHTGLPHLSPGKGRSELGKRAAEGFGEEETLQTSPKRSLASGTAASDAMGRTPLSTARKWGELEPRSTAPSDAPVASLPTHLMNGRCLDVGEKRKGESRSPASTSDPSVGSVSTGVPEPPAPHSSSMEAGEDKETALSAAQCGSSLEAAATSESTPEKAGPLLVTPAPLHPELTVNGTPWAAPAGSVSQNFSMLDVGAGSLAAATLPADSAQLLNTPLKVPENAHPNEPPRPVSTHPKDQPSFPEGMENHLTEKIEERTEPKPVIMPKPKHVRPKIITYVRRNPQALGQADAPGGLIPVGLPCDPASCSMPLPKEAKPGDGDLKPPTTLYEKCKPDLQKPRVFGSALMVSGIKPPGHHLSQMSEQFLQEVTERPGKEEYCSPACTHYEVPPTFYRSAMLLKPQLGLGAMSRLPSAKSRILIASQRASASAIHPPGPITAAASLYSSDPTDLKKASCSNAAKANLPKSGLRPPGYSRLPAAKLAAFGFVRSSSVSSVSSTQSVDGLQPEQSKMNRPTFGNEDPSSLKASLPSKDTAKGASRVTPPASSSVTTPRRSLLPAPKSTSTPAGTKKEVQKDQETNKAVISSPKRAVTATSKLHSPGHPKQRTPAPRNGFSPKPDLQAREAERQLVQRLKERCELQARQLGLVQCELRKAVCSFEALAVTTQHFFGKSESAVVKGKELSIELANIRDEVAFSSAKCEKLQKEKEALELRLQEEVRQLGWQQQAELRALEERLQGQFQAELARLGEEHGAQLLRVHGQHQRQVDDITGSHEAALLEMESNHTIAIAILQDDHDHKVQELMATHKLEKKELEKSFEELRLSLQDQVDTLTFQSECLRDRARRFEEALRKNTEEQLEMALAPYQHLEEDMASLKQVLEMKNQRIHQQEKRIIELEKLAEKNVVLEERIQVLQQQNEDLKARIDQNTVVTRQLSEENANLQEHVEKEAQEKKRLSRTNEELLWKLQAGEPASPVRLSPTSPGPRGSSSGPSSPARVGIAPR